MDAIIAFISNFIDQIIPWAIVQPWEEGLRVRFGRYTTPIHPGTYFHIPFFDDYHVRDIKPRVINLPNQTIKTADDKVLTVSAAMAYQVVEVSKTFTEVYDHEDSLINMTMGQLADYIATHTAAECTIAAIRPSVERVVRREAKKWGVEVQDIYLTDLAEVAVLRLLQDNNFRDVGSRLQPTP